MGKKILKKKIKCKYGNNYKYCDCFLEYTEFKDNLIEYKCLCCNQNYQQKFEEKLKEHFFDTYKFSNHDNNNCILFLWKYVSPYQNMDDWEIFNETSLPGKEDFYCLLNMEDITDADYTHVKRFWNK